MLEFCETCKRHITDCVCARVQGAASASEDNKYDCPGDVRFGDSTPTKPSSGEAKGAAVKPWQERIAHHPDHAAAEFVDEAKDAEIAEWRALAERAQAALPSGAVVEWVNEEQGFQYLINGRLPDGTKLYATPAPEQEAAQVGAKPVAWMRRWAFDGEQPAKQKKENGRMAWPFKFKLLPVTSHKMLPDDVPLAPVAQEAEQPQGDVRHVMSTDCRYDASHTDPGCTGCVHSASAKSYTAGSV